MTPRAEFWVEKEKERKITSVNSSLIINIRWEESTGIIYFSLLFAEEWSSPFSENMPAALSFAISSCLHWEKCIWTTKLGHVLRWYGAQTHET